MCPRRVATVALAVRASHVLLPAGAEVPPGRDLVDRPAAVHRDAHPAPPLRPPVVGGRIELGRRSFDRVSRAADRGGAVGPMVPVAARSLRCEAPRSPQVGQTAAVAKPGPVGVAARPAWRVRGCPQVGQTLVAHHPWLARRCRWDGWAQQHLSRVASLTAELSPGR